MLFLIHHDSMVIRGSVKQQSYSWRGLWTAKDPKNSSQIFSGALHKKAVHVPWCYTTWRIPSLDRDLGITMPTWMHANCQTDQDCNHCLWTSKLHLGQQVNSQESLLDPQVVSFLSAIYSTLLFSFFLFPIIIILYFWSEESKLLHTFFMLWVLILF